MLRSFLDYHRATLVMKRDGLTDDVSEHSPGRKRAAP
jgi:hypothetical protein